METDPVDSMTSEDSADDKSVKSQETHSRQLTANVANTKYSVVRYVLRKALGFRLVEEENEENCDVYWYDSGVEVERLLKLKLKPYQKINHFPGMSEIGRKNNLARNLNRMRKYFPKDYNFYPRTWMLPREWIDFAGQFTKKQNKTFIVKPEASCQGRGIFLTRRLEDIDRNERYVAQRYLHKPFLLDGLKFDLRIYVLVAGCDPLRVYIHREGLARLATQPYTAPNASNIDDMCMHLTNYAVNKLNPAFVFNEDKAADDIGHKRSLTWTLDHLRDRGFDVDLLWRRICGVVMKTMAVVQPTLAHNYKSCQPDDPTNSMCFEVLGFDVFLNHNLKPYVLEVNMSPSLATDSPLDKKIKRQVLTDALTLINVSYKAKKAYLAKKKTEAQLRTIVGRIKESREDRRAACLKAQGWRDKYENKHLGGFEKIYPVEDRKYYDQFIEKAVEGYHERTGVRSHTSREESKQASRLPTPMKIAQVSSIRKLQKVVEKPHAKSQSKILEKPYVIPKIEDYKPFDQQVNQVKLSEPKITVTVYSRLAPPKKIERTVSSARFTPKDYDANKERIRVAPSSYNLLSRLQEIGLGKHAEDLLFKRDLVEERSKSNETSGRILKTPQQEVRPTIQIKPRNLIKASPLKSK